MTTRMIRFVGAAALALLLTSGGGGEDDGAGGPRGYARHGVGSTWTTVWEPRRERPARAHGFDRDHSFRGFGGAIPGIAAGTPIYERITEVVAGRQTYSRRNGVSSVAVVVEAVHEVQVGSHTFTSYGLTWYLDPRSGNPVAVRINVLPWVPEPANSGELIEFQPHTGVLSLPLEVGKTWMASYTAEHPGGSVTTETSRWEVVSLEEVITPAGTFTAFRILRRDAGDPSFELYYDPALALVVKTVSPAGELYLVSHDLM